MGWSFRHPDLLSDYSIRLDEHGGLKEREHEELYQDLMARLQAAVHEIMVDPRYNQIVLR